MRPDRRRNPGGELIEKAREAEVTPPVRFYLYNGPRIGGQGGWVHAARDWALSFRDPDTGRLCTPPFPRESAFFGPPNGPTRWRPDLS